MITKNFSNRLTNPNRDVRGGAETTFSDNNCNLRAHIRSNDIDIVFGDNNNGRWGNGDDEEDPDEKRRRRGSGWMNFLRGWRTYPKSRRRFLPLLLMASFLLLVLLHQTLVWLVGKPPLIPLTDLPQIDFVVGGFPKSGTTTLLYALRRHNPLELRIPSRESCALKDTWRPVYRVRERYHKEVADLFGKKSTQHNTTSVRNHQHQVITGLKCPTAIYSHNYMFRLAEINRHHQRHGGRATRPFLWVIGIRHPVWQVQSFYNYRITELYDKNKWWKDIRSLQDIMFSTVPWKDMSSSSHQYQHHILDLLSFWETNETVYDTFHRHELARTQQQPRIFLYLMEQIQDTNEERSLQFRRDLSTFLGLSETLGPLGKENVNKFASGPSEHAEIIHICEDQYIQVRRKIVQDSVVTATWIQQHVLGSPTTTKRRDKGGAFYNLTTAPRDAIVVSNHTFVHEALEAWKRDPCIEEEKVSRAIV